MITGWNVNRHLPRLMFIYNPLAGPADVADTVELVADFWQARGWRVAVRATQYAGHAAEMARAAAADGYRMVLAGGGDGTLGEVANGLVHSETILAPLPMGTGNSFGKELNIPRPNLVDHRALVEASALLASGRVQRMDVGRQQNGRYWLLWTGTGADGFLVNEIEPRSKLTKRLGAPGYALQAFQIVPRFPGMRATVQVDEQQFDDEYMLVTVSNCRKFGGGLLLLSPAAALDDGLFEVWLVRGHGFLKLLRMFAEVRRGRHLVDPDIQVVTGRQVTVHTSPPMGVHTDGDPAGVTPFSCEMVPAALRVLIPPSAPAGLFAQPGLSLPEVLRNN